MLIADQFPISHASLVRASEMHPEDLERAVQRLLAAADPTRVVRKVESAPGKVYYRIPSMLAAEELNAAIERIRAQSDLVRVLRPLLEVCQQFFAEDGHPDLPDTIEQLLREGGHGGHGTSADSGEPPRVLFQARGQVIERSSVPDLFREIVRRFGTDPSLQQRVPFSSGRVRYLVARDGHHAAGHSFVSPLEFKEARLVFEANQSRLSALKNLRAWFADAQIVVERAEIDGQSIDELGAPVAGGVEAAALTSSDDELSISLRLGDETEIVTGRTVGTFLSQLVARLVEEGRLTVEQLPVRTGRIRYLVAQAPEHANGRRFDSPVETEGMYIESALTRADARFHAAMLCHSVGVEVLDGGAFTDAAT